MSQTGDPANALDQSCRDALGYLQERRPEAQVIASQGDWAYISLGTIHVRRVNDVFKQEKAHAVIRVPTDFPSATDPYGFVTIPYLTRTDDEDVHREHKNHNNSQPVEQALGVNDTGFWSYKWKGISASDEEDLAKAVDIVRSRLRKE